MAYTGIAATLLPFGLTTHKTFGLKVPLSSDSVSCIRPGSSRGLELAQVDVFLLDEAPMLPKYDFIFSGSFSAFVEKAPKSFSWGGRG